MVVSSNAVPVRETMHRCYQVHFATEEAGLGLPLGVEDEQWMTQLLTTYTVFGAQAGSGWQNWRPALLSARPCLPFLIQGPPLQMPRTLVE